MSKKMLYRLAGEPERGVIAVVLDGRQVEAKIFDRGEKPEGWVSAASLIEFMESEGDATVAEIAREIVSGDPISDVKSAIEGLEDKEAKLYVDQWAAERGIKLDRRNTLATMIEALEKALANG